MQILRKPLALLTAISLLVQNLIPIKSFALTGGPQSPEFSNFESVSTSQMVDPFTGDFTYNLPLLDVPGPNGGGYPISLSYHSGSSPEEEASWVGYGWTLNPGAVLRNKQAYPDDANGDEAIYFNRIGTNSTIMAGTESYLKLFEIPGISDMLNAVANVNVQLGFSYQAAYNNRTGLSMQYVPYLNASVACVSANTSLTDGEARFTYDVDPGSWIEGMLTVAASPTGKRDDSPLAHGVTGIISDFVNSSCSSILNKSSWANNHMAGNNKTYTLYNNSAPTVLQDYQGVSMDLRFGAFVNPTPIPIGYGGAVFGSGTFQWPANKGFSLKRYYGYLHSYNAINVGEDELMDYTVEKQDVYNLRDNYLPIPHSGADMYSVISEGLSGTFRAYSSTIGHFRPNEQDSHTDKFTGSLEFGAGLENSVTTSVTVSAGEGGNDQVSEESKDVLEAIVGGGHDLKVGIWHTPTGYEFPENTQNDNYYFRMIGDMGGQAEFNNVDDEVVSAHLNAYYPAYSSSLEKTVNNGDGVTRAVNIGFHTNAQMAETESSGSKYNRYSYRHDKDLESSFTRAKDDGIGEFSITNTNGTQYIYALPVYAKKEAELSVDVTRNSNNDPIVYKDITDYMSTANNVVEKFTNNATYTVTDDDIKIGEEEKLVGVARSDRYATSHLLTQITQANYIDVTNDGPSSDDIGAWTKFNYTKLSNDYHWRMPYKGLYYNPGNMADSKDDMGSFRYGDKEVYYLKSIETATHIAEFETSNRADGIQAPDDITPKKGTTAGTEDAQVDANATSPLQKLDQITLYAKNIDGSKGKVIKRIYLKYDYSAWQGIPNFDSSVDAHYEIEGGSSDDNKGKLTLKKVWTEYGDVSNATISPFEFAYKYPTTDYPTKPKYEKQDTNGDEKINDDDEWIMTNPDEYADLENFGNGLDEEPQYSSNCTDRWGYYRSNGDELVKNMFAWVDQTPDADWDGNAITSKKFDPAAWQLKQIKLPTGAEIHVQYEQDDYCFVQNRKAMAMVSLDNYVTPKVTAEKEYGNTNNTIYLDLSKLGIENDNVAIEKMKDYIQKNLIDESKKAYFNFLYSLNTDAADVNACNSAYVGGFINVSKVGVDKDADGKDHLYVQMGGDDDESDWQKPYDACIEMYKSSFGNQEIINSATCENSSLLDMTGLLVEGDAQPEKIGTIVYEIVDHYAASLTGQPSTVCTHIDLSHSYIRLPLPYEKKGGGLRVKRLLTYDAGLEDKDNMVYGHEYHYIGYDGLSSGVATNEPLEGGEENALIGYLAKRDESSDEQVMAAGYDKSQFRGPIGENILPGPSVGYSRVVTRNIHSAPTHDGFTAYEFYTTKDYPFDKKYSYTDASGATKEYRGTDHSDLDVTIPDDHGFYAVLVVENKLDAYAFQGYKFILNGMNGQPKKQTEYSGLWNNYNNPDSLQEVSSVRYNYCEPGESVNALDKDGITPGKASEIIAETKEVSDETGTNTFSLHIGEGTCGTFIIPWILPIPVHTTDQTHFYSHVTTQTDYYPPILKSVTKYQDGTYSTVNNLFYNALNGEPIVTSASGIHDQMKYSTDGTTELTNEGKYFSYKIPATEYYDGMGQKAGSEGFYFDTESSAYSGKLSFTQMIRTIDKKDFIELKGTEYENVLAKFSVGDLISINKNSITEIANVTAIEGKDVFLSSAEGFDFSAAYNQKINAIRILKSGKANLLSIGAETVVSYGKEFDIASTDNIVSASANTFTNTYSINDAVKTNYGVDKTTNTVESGEAGKWTLDASYIYKTNLQTNDLSFKSGLFSDFEYFKYDNPSAASAKWIQTNTSTAFAPDGNLLEEKNALGIYSSTKFGYNNTLPFLVANNAEYESVYFDSFENLCTDGTCSSETSSLCFDDFKMEKDFCTLSTTQSHSGSNSIKVSLSTSDDKPNYASGSFYLHNFNPNADANADWTVNTQMIENGYSIKMWVKSNTGSFPDFTLNGKTSSADAAFATKTTTTTSTGMLKEVWTNGVSFSQIAQTGEWALYEAKINPENWRSTVKSSLATSLYISMTYTGNSYFAAVIFACC